MCLQFSLAATKEQRNNNRPGGVDTGAIGIVDPNPLHRGALRGPAGVDVRPLQVLAGPWGAKRHFADGGQHCPAQEKTLSNDI